MKKIGITGVMGAGKSSVIQVLRDMNYVVLDCDRINDELLMRGHKGYLALTTLYGNAILDADNNINRTRMSSCIFSDKKRKEEVEHILHPMIQEEILSQCTQNQNETFLFVEVPLLFEVRWESFFNEVWVVASEEALLLERLSTFRGVSIEEAKRRLQHQMPQEVKIQKADIVIWNNSDKEHLQQQIYDIIKRN